MRRIGTVEIVDQRGAEVRLRGVADALFYRFDEMEIVQRAEARP